MSAVAETERGELVSALAEQLRAAADAKKCWRCGCFQDTLAAVERHLAPEHRSDALRQVVADGRDRLLAREYDCLGCAVCWPAVAMNHLVELAGPEAGAAATCPTEAVAEPGVWPPLPGDYTVLRYAAPVAVCALTSETLAAEVAAAAPRGIALVGTVQTENLGLERILANLLANPHIRHLVVCGEDSRQTIGHLPGGLLLALAEHGLDDRGRIRGAPGKRPVLRNLDPAAVEHFRATVEVIDRIGVVDAGEVASLSAELAGRGLAPASPFAGLEPMPVVTGRAPERVTIDPAGYFVIDLDRARGRLRVEHYRRDGRLTTVIEGGSPAEVYGSAIEAALVSRLDHAAYLGQELARAEAALRAGERYVQDAAAEAAQELVPRRCGCGDERCGGDR